MIWIFASVVIVLCVYSRGFRKVTLVTGGIGAALFALLLVAQFLN
jgi:hypothetical protein